MTTIIIVIIPGVWQLSDKLSHTRYNRNDDCGKSLEKPAAKLVAAKMTFVHNCEGSSSGKKIKTDRESK